MRRTRSFADVAGGAFRKLAKTLRSTSPSDNFDADRGRAFSERGRQTESGCSFAPRFLQRQRPGSRLVHVRSEPVALVPVEGRAGTIRRRGLSRGCSLRLAGAAGESENNESDNAEEE